MFKLKNWRTFQILGTFQKWKVLSSSNWDLSRLEGSVLVLKMCMEKIWITFWQIAKLNRKTKNFQEEDPPEKLDVLVWNQYLHFGEIH